jgi:hypothetical protein
MGLRRCQLLRKLSLRCCPDDLKMLHVISQKLEVEMPSRDQEVSELSQNTEIAALVDEIERAREN